MALSCKKASMFQTYGTDVYRTVGGVTLFTLESQLNMKVQMNYLQKHN